MPKLKTIYICQACEYESQKWIGKCPSCEAWNSFTEDVVEKSISSTPRKIETQIPTNLNSITTDAPRLSTNIEELDRVLGGGLVNGSLTLLTGEPGIGKSTLTLQIAAKLAKYNNTLIISGEESVEQIASRANRLKINEKKLTAINEHQLESILELIRKNKPSLAIIDSIQVISSLDLPGTAGSISQVRYCTEKIMELAKAKGISIILIGHVTKEGNLAGPRVLEHLVDTVLHFEGDRFQQFRMLRAAKNRFGNCNEVGIFEMGEFGLQEVNNPSEQFLEGRKKNAIGSALTVAIEGTRPFIVEVQALVTTTAFGFPKRTANGFDLNRLQILIAVLEKHGKLQLQSQDIFINVVGGIKLKEPAADLAVLMAIASSFLKRPLDSNSVIFGEVGLSGELRKVSHADKRKKESEKLGFNAMYNFKEILEALSSL